MIYQVPGACKYYPKYKVVLKAKAPTITISKADLNRTRNFLLLPRYHEEYASTQELLIRNGVPSQYSPASARRNSQNVIGDMKQLQQQ
jgi:hypothetical protein